MEILSRDHHKDLLGYLAYVKGSLKEWLFVDIRLEDDALRELTIEKTASSVHALFKDKEGKLFICNEREILMIVRWGAQNPASIVADSVSKALPEEGCQIYVHEPTAAGVAKLEILISYRKVAQPSSMAEMRAQRRENVILVADDDMYMRLLVKKGIGSGFTVQEVGDGGEVVSAYKKFVPDVLLLDIHMPNMDGTKVLEEILAIDAKAYVVMLSADSSLENVQGTAHSGAKGFLTKPFTKDKLHDYLVKCPTIAD